MAEAVLRCNVQTCRKKLEDEALATSCSHIFCVEHGQEVITSKSCLACGTKYKNKFDYALNNLQITDQHKSVSNPHQQISLINESLAKILLNGLNPEQILEIASRSISFYTYQINQENEIKEQMIKQSNEEKERVQSYCNMMALNYKAEVEKLKRAAQSLKIELEEKIKETEKQREYIVNCSRINKKFQLQLESYKRQIASLKGRNAGANFRTSSEQTPSGSGLNQNLQFNFSPNGGIFDTDWPNSRYTH